MLLLSTGEHESVRARAHLRSCDTCWMEYARLRSDLEKVVTALQNGPPRRAARATAATPLRWVAMAVAASLLIALGVGVRGQRQPEELVQLSDASNPDVLAEEVSSAVFPASAQARSIRVVGGAGYLQAALGTGVPCTSRSFVDEGCNDHLSALLFEGE